MDYLKLLKGLKKEFLVEGRNRYLNINVVCRFLLTIIFIPMRVGFFFARIGYWLTWLFFKALAAPVDYLQAWLKEQKEDIAPATQAVLYFVCMPTIFLQQVLLAFSSFAFFFQWLGLVVQAYILTLGAVRWQPVVTEAHFDETVDAPVAVAVVEE